MRGWKSPPSATGSSPSADAKGRPAPPNCDRGLRQPPSRTPTPPVSKTGPRPGSGFRVGVKGPRQSWTPTQAPKPSLAPVQTTDCGDQSLRRVCAHPLASGPLAPPPWPRVSPLLNPRPRPVLAPRGALLGSFLPSTRTSWTREPFHMGLSLDGRRRGRRGRRRSRAPTSQTLPTRARLKEGPGATLSLPTLVSRRAAQPTARRGHYLRETVSLQTLVSAARPITRIIPTLLPSFTRTHSPARLDPPTTYPSVEAPPARGWRDKVGSDRVRGAKKGPPGAPLRPY